MRHEAHRQTPIPSGTVSEGEALGIGLRYQVSIVLLFLATNALAAGLLAFTIFSTRSSIPCGNDPRRKTS
jgi:protoheme IX farnesyltransferase